MMLRSLSVRGALVFAILMASSGCGGKAVSVTGTIKLNGQPLPDASVIFIAQDDGGKDAHGYTDANGVFRLADVKPGKYKVVVQAAARSDGPAAATQEEAQKGAAAAALAPQKPLIAARFSQPDQTVLIQEIPANGEIVFDVKSE